MGLRRLIKNLYKSKADLQKDGFIAEPSLEELHLNETYSQEGEDGVLGRIFDHCTNGFYVDVGALHPMRYSNTYRFYKKGWRGINIDAMPGSMENFKQYRPLDINLEVPVSDEQQVLPFYIFNEPALNTLSKDLADERKGIQGIKLERVVEIRTEMLADILDKYLPEGQHINFLTIDAEGFDFQILKSNNWIKYRPDIILVEIDMNFSELLKSELYLYMRKHGYDFFAKTVLTYFFKKDEFKLRR